MTEVNLYHLTKSTIAEVLPKLLERAVGNGVEKILVSCSDEAQMTSLDQRCWSYSTNVFLPHATINDPYIEEQPILFTVSLAKLEELRANILVNLCSDLDLNALKPNHFNKILDIFDGGNETELSMARERYKSYKNMEYNIVYYKQNSYDNGWEKK